MWNSNVILSLFIRLQPNSFTINDAQGRASAILLLIKDSYSCVFATSNIDYHVAIFLVCVSVMKSEKGGSLVAGSN